MLNRLCLIVALALSATVTHAQGLFERVSLLTGQSIHMFGFDPGSKNFISSGTGALYMVPHSVTNESVGTPVIVTAKHNLYYPQSTNPLPALLIKLNVPMSEQQSKFLFIPLKHDHPKNYWVSGRGLDLAAIPYPIGSIDISTYPMFHESNILTAERARTSGVQPGLLVSTMCHQPEYFSEIDLFLPTAAPIVRFGHLSKLGWDWISETNWISRSHVIDMHASPGNSGATVTLNVILEDSRSRRPFFLGIVQGYQEEASSYRSFEAPIKSIDTGAITLTSSDNQQTNQVALSIKTLANPDLTSVTPVDELVGIWGRQDFMEAIAVMLLGQSLYQVWTGPILQ